MRVKKSLVKSKTGLGDIYVKSLKVGSPILAYYLTYIYNLLTLKPVWCLIKCWKRIKVIPLYQKADAEMT